MNARLEWLGGVDPARRDAFQRSLTVSSAGTVLLQTSISKAVQLLVNRDLGVTSTLPRVEGSGDKFYVNRRTAANTGGDWYIDTDAFVESEGSYAQVGFGFKTIGGKIKVTRRLIAQGRTYGDVLGGELIAKADDFVNDLETASVTGSVAANSKQIDGLLTLIGAVSGQTVANTTSNNGDDLVLTKLDETIQKVKGHGQKSDLLIYVSRRSGRLLNAALQAQQRFVNVTEIDGGFTVETYGGIPIVETTALPDVLVFNAAAPLITAFSGGATSAIVIVNKRYVFYAELTPMTVMPLAKTSSQYDEVEMFNDIVLVLANTLGGAILGGLAP